MLSGSPASPKNLSALATTAQGFAQTSSKCVPARCGGRRLRALRGPRDRADLLRGGYEKSSAKTDYLEFEGRPHLHLARPDWQEVAQAVDSRLAGVLDAPTA
jgi:hypothetical protein